MTNSNGQSRILWGVGTPRAYFQQRMRTIEQLQADQRAYLLGDGFSAADLLLSACRSRARAYRVGSSARTQAYNKASMAQPAYNAATQRNSDVIGRAADQLMHAVESAPASRPRVPSP